MRALPACILRIIILILLLVLSMTSCGGDRRMLLSVTVSPASADAQQFAGGQVQFTAKGTYNTSPITVDPLPNVVWTVNRPPFSGTPNKLSDPMIDSNGVAQCSPTSQGTSTISAAAAKNPNQIVSLTNEIVGSAQLTCP